MTGTDKFTKAIDQSAPGVSNGVDINGVSLAPLRKEGAPGFKLALSANTDAAAAADVPANTVAVEVYCDQNARMALGEAAVEGDTSGTASVGRKVPSLTSCYFSLDAVDVAAGVKIHAISAYAATFEVVYIPKPR